MAVITPPNEIVPPRGPLDLTKPLQPHADPVLAATAAQLAPRRIEIEPGADGATHSQAVSMKRIADALEVLCEYAAVIAHPNKRKS